VKQQQQAPLIKETQLLFQAPSFTPPTPALAGTGECQYPNEFGSNPHNQAALSKQRNNIFIQRASAEYFNFPRCEIAVDSSEVRRPAS